MHLFPNGVKCLRPPLTFRLPLLLGLVLCPSMDEDEPEPKRPYVVTCHLDPDVAERFEAMRFFLYRGGVTKSLLLRDAILMLIEDHEQRFGPLVPTFQPVSPPAPTFPRDRPRRRARERGGGWAGRKPGEGDKP